MDKLLLRGAGWAVGYVTRSKASTPLLFLYVLVSIFAFVFKEFEVWKYSTFAFVGVFIFLIVFLPNRIWSEKLNFELKKLDLLGEKGKKFEATNVIEVFQPVEERGSKRKK